MRILMISDHADPLAEVGSKEAGGQNIYVYNLSVKLAKEGHFVDVYTRWDKKNKKEIIKRNHHLRIIRVKAGPKRYMPRDNFLSVLDEFTKNIEKRIEKEGLKYELIHSNYWFSGLSGIALSKKMKVPLVHVYHSIGKLRLDALRKYKIPANDNAFFQVRKTSEQKIARMCKKIIATSPVEKKLIKKIFQIDKEKIEVIPIGIDPKIFFPKKVKALRRKYNIDDSQKIILYVGRIEWRKGIGTLLYAMKDVLSKNPNTKLLIVGGGKTKTTKGLEEAEIMRQKNIIEELNLTKNVLYCGSRNQIELCNFYNVANVCVVPSYYEPFGIVPLESMACGTPVVATKTGGLQFTVKDGKTGHLTRPHDYKDLSQKINLVLKKGKSEYGDLCESRVLNEFTWERIIGKYELFFDNLSDRKDQDENRNIVSVRGVRSSAKVRWNRVGRL